MKKEDKELVKLLILAAKGNKNSYAEVCNRIYDEVYNIVSFIYSSDEAREKLTKHILVKMYKNASKFDYKSIDVHLWIARYTTVETYNICTKQNGSLFTETRNSMLYNYSAIKDDTRLANVAASMNDNLFEKSGLLEHAYKFKGFTKGQKILYLMYCYENYSSLEIKKILKLDDSTLSYNLSDIRRMLLDNIDDGKEVVESQAADEASNDVSDDVTDSVVEADTESSDDSVADYSNVGAGEIEESDENARFFGFISPRVMTWISAGAIAVIILITAIFVISFGKSKKASSAENNVNEASTLASTTTKAGATKAVAKQSTIAATGTNQNNNDVKAGSYTETGTGSGSGTGTVQTTKAANVNQTTAKQTQAVTQPVTKAANTDGTGVSPSDSGSGTDTGSGSGSDAGTGSTGGTGTATDAGSGSSTGSDAGSGSGSGSGSDAGTGSTSSGSTTGSGTGADAGTGSAAGSGTGSDAGSQAPVTNP